VKKYYVTIGDVRGNPGTEKHRPWHSVARTIVPEWRHPNHLIKIHIIFIEGYSSGKNSARIRASLYRFHANGVVAVLQILVPNYTFNPA
jgi:hypothetical protein